MERFGEQSWSVVEFLCGEQAPQESKAAFTAFLKDSGAEADRKRRFFSTSATASAHCTMRGDNGCSSKI